jgi:hypothetical protein
MAGVEVATKISELVATAPPGSDPKSEGDNHIRLLKGVLQDVFDDSGDTLKTTLPIESPDGAVLGNVTIAGVRNPLVLKDGAAIERARIAATETAGTGGVTITAKDEASDEESKLIIGPAYLQYSGDDSTKILQVDQSRQETATTRKLYVPAAPIDTVMGIWEPIYCGTFTCAANAPFTNAVLRALGAFQRLRITADLKPGVNDDSFGCQYSSDGGTTWYTTSGDYVNSALRYLQAPSGITDGSSGVSIFAGMTGTSSPAYGSNFEMVIPQFNKPEFKMGRGTSANNSTTNSNNLRVSGAAFTKALALNAIRFLNSSNTAMTVNMLLEGIRG